MQVPSSRSQGCRRSTAPESLAAGIAGVLLWTLAAHAQTPPLSPRNASYSIDARLDPVTRTIAARATLVWRNIASGPADDLRFHLYWNAWKNTRSTWMRERRLAGNTTLAARPEADRSSIDVTALRLVGGPGAGADLTAVRRFIAPDDGNADDETVMAVPLPVPVAPGETLTVEIVWRAKVPRPFARTGAIGDFFFIAHWFPKIAVLEDGGWNAHQFHTATEFFADFGVYDVRLTVPSAWVVGATGREIAQTANPDGTTTHQYRAEDVHDFAWTTSPDYLERRARFDGVAESGLPPVEMRLLLQPEHTAQEARHFDATRAALRWYGEWYGPYPYDHLTIVDPAWQSGAGGMEYPTLFTAGSRWLAPVGGNTPERLTVHEAGHQWWYGVVASNEFEHAWMDEGLNSFSEARLIEGAFSPFYLVQRFFGGFIPWVQREIPLSRATVGNRLYGFRPVARTDDQATPTFQAFPGTITNITYGKTALWLHTLERWLGWGVVQPLLRTYFARSAFRHPVPDEFFAIASEVSGRDLTPFFDQVFRSSHVFDYGIDTLFSVGADAGGTAMFRTEVVARRHGEAVFPVDVLVTFDDGEEVREAWNGEARWQRFTYERVARARSAVVDPDRTLLLDVNYVNNSRTLAPRAGEAATKWSLTWLVWLQDLMLTWAFLV
jgi:hypothetical protein